MINTYSPYIITEVFNNRADWEGVIKKLNKTLWSQMQLILPRIYLLFQQENTQKNNTWLLKISDASKTSPNFDKIHSEYYSQIHFRISHQIL